MSEHNAIPKRVTMTHYLQGVSLMTVLSAALVIGAALTTCLN